MIYVIRLILNSNVLHVLFFVHGAFGIDAQSTR